MRTLVLSLSILGIGLAVLTATAADAAPAESTTNEQRYVEKLQKPFVSKIEWRRSLDVAMTEAARDGRLVFGYFTRSYAPCPPCNALEDGPLVSDWWGEASSEVVPYLNVTAQWDGAPDQGLITKLLGFGFPYCALIDSDGGVVWEVRPESRDVWDHALAGARRLATLRSELEADASDDATLAAKRATATLLDAIGRVQRPWPSIESLDAAAAVAGVPEDVRAWYAAERSTKLMQRAIRADDGGRSALELYRDGERPDSARQGLPFSFYRAALEGAITERDVAVGRELLEKFAGSMDQPEYTGWMRSQVAGYRERLDAIETDPSGDAGN